MNLTTSDIIAIIGISLTCLSPIVWGLIRLYFQVQEVGKELTANSHNDAKTRSDLHEITSDFRLISQKVQDMERIPSDIQKSLDGLMDKMDTYFAKKKEYVDAEVAKVDSRISVEIKRLEGVRKEDIERYTDLFRLASKNNTRTEERLAMLSESQSEIKGMLNTLLQQNN
jgi:hypothetical protein